MTAGRVDPQSNTAQGHRATARHLLAAAVVSLPVCTAVLAGFVGSGMLSASGDIYVLKLIDGAWEVVDSFNYMIA